MIRLLAVLVNVLLCQSCTASAPPPSPVPLRSLISLLLRPLLPPHPAVARRSLGVHANMRNRMSLEHHRQPIARVPEAVIPGIPGTLGGLGISPSSERFALHTAALDVDSIVPPNIITAFPCVPTNK